VSSEKSSFQEDKWNTAYASIRHKIGSLRQANEEASWAALRLQGMEQQKAGETGGKQ
jgi:hypothetical protein